VRDARLICRFVRTDCDFAGSQRSVRFIERRGRRRVGEGDRGEGTGGIKAKSGKAKSEKRKWRGEMRGTGDWGLGTGAGEMRTRRRGEERSLRRGEEKRREEVWIEKKASGHEASGPRDRRRQQSGGSGLEGGNVIPAPRGWCGVVKHRQQATCRRSGLVAGLGFSLRVGRGGRAWCRGPTAFRSRWHQRRSLRSFRGGPRRGTWSSWRRGCRAG